MVVGWCLGDGVAGAEKTALNFILSCTYCREDRLIVSPRDNRNVQCA